MQTWVHAAMVVRHLRFFWKGWLMICRWVASIGMAGRDGAYVGSCSGVAPDGGENKAQRRSGQFFTCPSTSLAGSIQVPLMFAAGDDGHRLIERAFTPRQPTQGRQGIDADAVAALHVHHQYADHRDVKLERDAVAAGAKARQGLLP